MSRANYILELKMGQEVYLLGGKPLSTKFYINAELYWLPDRDEFARLFEG